MSELVPLKIEGQCVASDAELFAHMEAAILRGLPEIKALAPTLEAPIAIVASGPSVSGELERIREFQSLGMAIVAVRDAHDWLIKNGIVPQFALSVDPLPESLHCFDLKHPDVEYVMASQCHPSMFDYLAGHKILLWHSCFQKDQKLPKRKMLIGGGTTSGLRAIAVFYVLGYRKFHLFGFDSCCADGVLRVNGTKPKDSDPIIEVQISPGGEVFICNAAMALQAQHFQDYYDLLPDATFMAHGHGLIRSIIQQRLADASELAALSKSPQASGSDVSFIHAGGPSMASYRYRAAIPAQELRAKLNDFTASTLIFAKPRAEELMDMARARMSGRRAIVDFCDDHFSWPFYKDALLQAEIVTCSTKVMAERIFELVGKTAHVIPDPYEFEEREPHCNGVNLLWFGHPINLPSLDRLRTKLGALLDKYPLRVVSGAPGTIPWSIPTMLKEFAMADIVIIPATADYKSANRAIEAIRQGCFVVAEPHPALNDIPGIWIGDIQEGIEWAWPNLNEVKSRTSLAASHVTERYSPQTVAAMWKTIIQLPITSEAAVPAGVAG